MEKRKSVLPFKAHKLETVKPSNESSNLRSSHQTLLQSKEHSQDSLRTGRKLPTIKISKLINPEKSQHDIIFKYGSSKQLYQKAKHIAVEKSISSAIIFKPKNINILQIGSNENSMVYERRNRLGSTNLIKSRSGTGFEDINETALISNTLANSHENSTDVFLEKILKKIDSGR